ncbi:TPA: hypothetical protein WIT53_001153 [Neisseria meningitidis]
MSWRIITRPAAGQYGKCRAKHRALAESGFGALKCRLKASDGIEGAGCGKVLPARYGVVRRDFR